MASPQLALSSNTVTLKPGIGEAGLEALSCGQAKGSGQDPPRHQAAGQLSCTGLQAGLQGTGSPSSWQTAGISGDANRHCAVPSPSQGHHPHITLAACSFLSRLIMLLD